MEDTPAYKALADAEVLCKDYRRSTIEDIFTGSDLRCNTSKELNIQARACWYLIPFGCCIYSSLHIETFVPAGHIGFLMNNNNEYIFLESGMHNIYGLTNHESGRPMPLIGHIVHGNRTIVIVEQGHIGYATDNGQPVLLPPGIHVWTSESLRYLKSVVLSDHLIYFGPYTLVTVDEGYVAITQNNGKQVILEGGFTHFLNHINWKFQKFMTTKIQTDDLQKTVATSADNVDMTVESTVNWRIEDPQVAAIMAAETMTNTGQDMDTPADITKLRKDVLKQALASLSAFIGSVNYSGSFNRSGPGGSDSGPKAYARQSQTKGRGGAAATLATARVQAEGGEGDEKIPSAPEPQMAVADSSSFMENPLYNSEKMESAMVHANEVTRTYGVEILSINIISAAPCDHNLRVSLASGAVAAAEAIKATTDAEGKAKAMIVDAKAKVDAIMMMAEGEAKAEVIRAESAKLAAIMRAEGEAEGTKIMSDALAAQGGENAMKQRLAQQFLAQYSEMVSKAQLIIVPDRPNDVAGILTQAMSVAGALKEP